MSHDPSERRLQVFDLELELPYDYGDRRFARFCLFFRPNGPNEYDDAAVSVTCGNACELDLKPEYRLRPCAEQSLSLTLQPF